jgi:hypothetical protein
MIPFGPWRPDSAGNNTPICRIAKNCLPAANGYRPLQGPEPSSASLGSECLGATTVLTDSGSSLSFAGTSDALYQLDASGAWTDVSRVSGGAYATAVGERWRFETFGDLVLATNFTDDIQKFSISGGGPFEALGGSPPKARYMAVIRDFLLLGGLFGNEKRVQWSGLNDIENWTAGTGSGDYQDIPSGGPVRGVTGGETGFVFQSSRVTRMLYVPGSKYIFQFDEVEGGRGLAAPSSLVRLGREGFYLSSDGFYKIDLGSGASQPIGVGKWSRWFERDIRAGTELSVLGAIAPTNRALLWAYISRDNTSLLPNKVLVYDWALDDATTADLSVEALAGWLTTGVSLDTMNSFGTLDELPYSLDSPFWRGGSSLLGLFGDDHKLSHLEGENMAAEWVTSDLRTPQRVLLTRVRPHINALNMNVEVASRERDGDPISYGPSSPIADTGEAACHAAGNYHRARIKIAAGDGWSEALAQPIEIRAKSRGRR